MLGRTLRDPERADFPATLEQFGLPSWERATRVMGGEDALLRCLERTRQEYELDA